LDEADDIEKRERDVQATFGRATTLYPRSLELLEQLNVADDLIQEGFVSRSSINFKDGKRVNERGWNLMFDHFKPCYHDYALNIRQRYSEDVFRNHFERYGKPVWFSWKLTTYAIDTSLGDGYNVTATLEHKTMGKAHVRWYGPRPSELELDDTNCSLKQQIACWIRWWLLVGSAVGWHRS
jgi:phenol 2-monooxygenase